MLELQLDVNIIVRIRMKCQNQLLETGENLSQCE